MKHSLPLLFMLLVAGCSVAPYQAPSAPSPTPKSQAKDTGAGVFVEDGVTVATLEDEHLGPGTVIEKPTNPAIAALRKDAQVAVLAGRYDTAAIAMERAVRIDPRDPYVWLELAKIRYTQGDYAQARELAEKAKALAGMDGRAKTEADLLIRRAR